MYFKSAEFWYEGLVQLSKDEVVKKLQEYVDGDYNEGDFESLNDAIEYLCEEGDIYLGHGYITMTSQYDGCDFDDWDLIK